MEDLAKKERKKRVDQILLEQLKFTDNFLKENSGENLRDRLQAALYENYKKLTAKRLEELEKRAAERAAKRAAERQFNDNVEIEVLILEKIKKAQAGIEMWDYIDGKPRFSKTAKLEAKIYSQTINCDPNLIFTLGRYRRHIRVKNCGGTWTKKQLYQLADAQGWKCVYCNCCIKRNMHGDHILPLSRGGSNSIDNIQALCPTCNLRKNSKTHEEFLDYIASQPLKRAA